MGVVTHTNPQCIPPPPIPAEEADAKSETKSDSRAGKEQSWIRIPARPNADGFSIDKPWIVFRHVDDLRISRLNHNRLALLRDGLLRCAFQVAGSLCAITHYLNGAHHFLLLVYVSIA